MRYLYPLLVWLLLVAGGAQAQKIDYSLPRDYRAAISAADYRVLVDLAVAALSKRYQVRDVRQAAIRLQPGPANAASTFNLHNLIGKCAAEPDKAKWPAVVQQHFDSLFSSFDEQAKIDPGNFESVRKYLSLRVYPAAEVKRRGGAENLVARADLPGTFTLLMLDLPGAFQGVPRAVAAGWQQTDAQLLALAQANINRQPVEKDRREVEMAGGNVSIHFLSEENYAASYVLGLAANSPELVGEWGSVVAVPHKGLASICLISRARPLDFVQFIQNAKPAIEKFYQEHPQPVSPDFYWFYEGKFTAIQVITDKNGQVNVLAPTGLAALMSAK